MKVKIRLYVINFLSVGEIITLNREQSHYVINVMRANEDEQILLFNGIDGEWFAVIVNCSLSNLKVIVKNIVRKQVDTPQMTLCFAPVKGIALNNIVRQATEMGVTSILPICSQFTVIRKVNLEKLRFWVIKASEQCERLDIPNVLPMVDFFELKALKKITNQFVICDEKKNYVKSDDMIQKKGEIFLIVGPEGGFSHQEREYSQDFCESISLGDRILRSDTAVVCSLAYINYKVTFI